MKSLTNHLHQVAFLDLQLTSFEWNEKWTFFAVLNSYVKFQIQFFFIATQLAMVKCYSSFIPFFMFFSLVGKMFLLKRLEMEIHERNSKDELNTFETEFQPSNS